MMGYLIWKNKIDVETALSAIRMKYEMADPNLGFLLQLQTFANDVLLDFKLQFDKADRARDNMEIEKCASPLEAAAIVLEQN
jgi:hypothetical protein